MSLLEIVVLAVWWGALIGLGVWDFHRTFAPVDREDRPPRVEPCDFAGEIYAHRVSRDLQEAKDTFR